MGKLSKNRVFIAGAASAIGQAIARAIIARDGQVILGGRSLEKLKKIQLELGPACTAICQIKLENEASLEQAMAAQGPFNHIISTAADLSFKPLLDTTSDEIQNALNSKIWGAINLARAAHIHLLPQGSLTLFSGVAAYRPGPGKSIVAGVNMFLEGFAAAMAHELAPARVNVISPGIVNTSLWDKMDKEKRTDFFAAVAKSLPTQRIGQPEDLAQAAIMVLENGFISGSVLHVDGGGRIA